MQLVGHLYIHTFARKNENKFLFILNYYYYCFCCLVAFILFVLWCCLMSITLLVFMFLVIATFNCLLIFFYLHLVSCLPTEESMWIPWRDTSLNSVNKINTEMTAMSLPHTGFRYTRQIQLKTKYELWKTATEQATKSTTSTTSTFSLTQEYTVRKYVQTDSTNNQMWQ